MARAMGYRSFAAPRLIRHQIRFRSIVDSPGDLNVETSRRIRNRMTGEIVPATTLDAAFDTALAAAIDRLAGLMRRFEPGNSLRAQKLLAQLGGRRFPDAASLIRFHEIPAFPARLPAHPRNAAKLRRTSRFFPPTRHPLARLGGRCLGLCRPVSVRHRGHGILSNLGL